MDIELRSTQSYFKLADQALRARLTRLEADRTGDSRKYNKIAHTKAMIGLLEEIRGVLLQDPDMWDDEPELFPF